MQELDSPNFFFALVGDVNLPENRGTVFGLGSLINGAGRAGGNGLAGVSFGYLAASFPAPLNYALGLALFQAFFIPTGLMYFRAAKTTPRDITRMKRIMAQRGRVAARRSPSGLAIMPGETRPAEAG